MVALGLPARAQLAAPQAPAPQVAVPEIAADGFRVLRARPGQASLRGGKPPTPVLTYDGAVPGPLLRVKRGEELRVRLVNELSEPTVLHWHGLRLPNAMGGLAHLIEAPVAPGASFDYRFRPPDAGTFWYHPAGNARGGRGLGGICIVDEAEPITVDRDVALVLDEWRLAADGGISTAEDASAVLTVNGTPAPVVPVRSNERLRLRLLNAALARPLMVRIGGHAVRVMAIDGQPAEPFPARDGRLVLAPGNRVDLFIDATLPPGSRAAITALDGRSEIELARLEYGPEVARPAPLGDTGPLPKNPLPERVDLREAARHELVLTALTPLPAPLKERPPLFSVRRGRTVVLACRNTSDVAQAVHLHGHHARLLDRLDDGWKPFWLDTLAIEARQTDRIAFVADNPGRWLIEAQPFAASMPASSMPRAAAWFEVT